jgi:DNA invertase Pin-like site-specific DNA recombinase
MPKNDSKWVLRVSTDRQGESGLGLEAQRKAVADFLGGGSWQQVAEYVEVESGKRSDRPGHSSPQRLAPVRSTRPN